MATNRQLRDDLLKKLGGVTPQRLSQLVQEVKRTHGPMSAEDGTYILAHMRGLDLPKYVDQPTFDRIRGMLQGAARQPDTLPASTRRAAAPRAEGKPVRLAPTSPAIDLLLPSTVANDANDMAGVYVRLYVLENSARNVIRRVLAALHGPGWWPKCAPTEAQREVQKRKDAEDNNPWTGKRGSHEIYYSDFGHLERLITGNWDAFKAIFPDQNFVARTLGGLEPTRNITAHNNPVAKKERQRLDIHLDDWQRQINARKHLIP